MIALTSGSAALLLRDERGRPCAAAETRDQPGGTNRISWRGLRQPTSFDQRIRETALKPVNCGDQLEAVAGVPGTGSLAISIAQYLNLVDWTGRQMHPGVISPYPTATTHAPTRLRRPATVLSHTRTTTRQRPSGRCRRFTSAHLPRPPLHNNRSHLRPRRHQSDQPYDSNPTQPAHCYDTKLEIPPENSLIRTTNNSSGRTGGIRRATTIELYFRHTHTAAPQKVATNPTTPQDINNSVGDKVLICEILPLGQTKR